jgi:hypothetical protein
LAGPGNTAGTMCIREKGFICIVAEPVERQLFVEAEIFGLTPSPGMQFKKTLISYVNLKLRKSKNKNFVDTVLKVKRTF